MDYELGVVVLCLFVAFATSITALGILYAIHLTRGKQLLPALQITTQKEWYRASKARSK